MSKELEIVAWNVKDNINDPQVHKAVLDSGFGVAVFPEASDPDVGVYEQTRMAFANDGYELMGVDYNDADGRADKHIMALAVRAEHVADVQTVRYAGRTTIQMLLKGGTTFTAWHGYDRTKDAHRNQIGAYLNSEIRHNAILSGDFNALHYDQPGASRARFIGKVASLFKAGEPGTKQMPWSRFGSLGQRAGDYADGETMRLLDKKYFSDLDPDMIPTMAKLAGQLAIQADHTMVRGNIEVIRHTVVESAEGLSDHDRIRSTVRPPGEYWAS